MRHLLQGLFIVTALALAGCEGPAGPAGATGPAGAAGTNGTNGADGTDGTNGTNGTNGASCSVVAYDGGVTVTCPGSNPVDVPNGANGASCAVAQIDGGVTVTCPGSAPVTVLNGTNATAPHNPKVEQCLICHGPGAIAPVTLMHNAVKGQTFYGGLNITVTSVSNTTPPVVDFAVTDDRGAPVDLKGVYSINTPFQPSFSISTVETAVAADGGTIMLPYKVLTRSGSLTAATTTDPAPAVANVIPNPTGITPNFLSTAVGTDPAMKGVLVEVGSRAGTYRYTFPTGGNTQIRSTSGSSAGKMVTTVVPAVAFDPAKLNNTHTLWIQASRQWDLINTSNVSTFKAVDKEFNFIPSGVGTTVARRIINQSACDKCHNGFKRDANPNAAAVTAAGGFHGGGRIEAPFCNVCHNPDRLIADGGLNVPANSAVFVHRLHGSSKLVANPDGGVPVDAFHGMQVDYSMDVRSCDTCHGGAAQGEQMFTRPSRAACGSCHNGTAFVATAGLPTCTNPARVDADGRFVACNHVVPQADDTACATCHTPTTLATNHLAVLPPSEIAVQPVALADGGTQWINPDGGASSTNVNAAWIAAANDVPAGALMTQYVVSSVSVVSNHPQMVFKLQQKLATATTWTDVDFGTYSATNKRELIDGFVGGPSAYFAWSVPQDGIATPADFNASASCYLKNAWNGTATTGTSACTLTRDAMTGLYTVVMTNVNLPATAAMLTGGLGYTYNIATARPLTQTNLMAYPYNAATGIGGLIVAAPNVYRVATGFTARRTIVETARCNNCHTQLGVGPTFHGGQRNDAPTCSFCHTPNRTSSAWSANSKDMIHSIHAGRIRTVPFNWHAISESENFGEVEFPSNVNNCEACHAPNTHDFTLASTTNAVPNMLVSTVATGKYNRDPATNPTGWFSIAPANYVLADNVYNYGSNFSFNVTTGAITPAATTTLVKTPLTAACSACHDAAASIAHMENNGGAFYRPRGEVF